MAHLGWLIAMCVKSNSLYVDASMSPLMFLSLEIPLRSVKSAYKCFQATLSNFPSLLRLMIRMTSEMEYVAQDHLTIGPIAGTKKVAEVLGILS